MNSRFIGDASDYLVEESVSKANPYHDEIGRFTFSPAGAKKITTDSGNTVSESEMKRRSSLLDESVNSTMLHSGYAIELKEPTDDLSVAKETGAPISFLMPNKYDPLLQEWYDGLLKKYTLENPSTNDRMLYESSFEKQIEGKGSIGSQGGLNTLLKRGFSLEEAIDVANGLHWRVICEARIARAERKKFIDKEKSQEEAEDYPFGSRDDDHVITINAGESAVASIFSEGRYKTQFETQSSGGTLSTEGRTVQEVASFSIHPSVNPTMRPVYGQVHPDGFDENLDMMASQYGNIVLVLDKKTRERTTWTEGDSLNNITTHSSLSEPTFHGLSSYNQGLFSFSEMDGGSDGGGYLEAQIHGGVKKSDIKYVILPADNAVGESLWETLIDAGVPKNMIVTYEDALDGDLSKSITRKILELPPDAKLVAYNSSSKLYSIGVVETERGKEHLGYVQHNGKEIYKVKVDDVYSRGYWTQVKAKKSFVKKKIINNIVTP